MNVFRRVSELNLSCGCIGRLTSRVLRLFRMAARVAALLPLMPLLAWGPFTHPVICRRALERAENELRRGSKKINRRLVEAAARNRNVFYFAGNSPDAISLNHDLARLSIYDYSHNYIPDLPTGSPAFGYALIDQWRKGQPGPGTPGAPGSPCAPGAPGASVHSARSGTPYPERDLAVACGWLAHQLADWYPHYAKITAEGKLAPDPLGLGDGGLTFNGYANAHRVFTPSYFPEVLRRYTMAGHGLIELFWDLVHYTERTEPYLRRNRMELTAIPGPGGPGDNLLTRTSERFSDQCRIPPEHLPHLAKDFNDVIAGAGAFLDFLAGDYPDLRDEVLGAFGPGGGEPDYFELSVEKVVDGLFRQSFEEIEALAQAGLAAAGSRERVPGGMAPGATDVPPVEVREIRTTPGTILFRIFRTIGSALAPKPGRSPLAVLWNRSLLFLDRSLLRLVIRRLRRYLAGAKARTSDYDALLVFFTALLSSRRRSLAAARKRFREIVRPVVSPRDDLPAMIQAGVLRLTFTPARNFAALKTEQEAKALDLRTLLVRWNGYDVRTRPDLFDFSASFRNNDPLEELEVTCRFKHDPPPGAHHLFAGVRDLGGVHSRHLDLEISRTDGTGR